ncbi:MAG: hypothetical protein HDQ94_02050 [Desulfovibrio sp.]|nr:hypothetical protein [Desulfovibrio sp.]
MKSASMFQRIGSMLYFPAPGGASAGGETRLALWGLAIGLLSGSIIAVFRISTSKAFAAVGQWFRANAGDPLQCALWLVPAVAAALVTGYFMRNPAIRSGAGAWVAQALAAPQKHVWTRILAPKFLGTWLVMACGLSVGREGPCIQMGASTALGLARWDGGGDAAAHAAKRRMLVLCGCAAGLAGAFSAPFAGIFYVLEVLKERITRNLLILMLGAALGVYLSATCIFGLGLMLPLKGSALPGLAYFWNTILVGLVGGFVGVVYAGMLRRSLALYARGRRFPVMLRPLLPFLAAAIMLLIYPQATGEGLSIFTAMESGALASTLLAFLCAKLLFTAFCYGSGVPAGVMVPILALGGVAGGLCGMGFAAAGIAGGGGTAAFITMGMASAFAAAEHAPLTSMVLVLEMTGAYAATPGLLVAACVATMLARIVRSRPV